MTDTNKLQFITQELFEKMKALQKDAKSNWGVMTSHEMTEHLSDFFNVSTEKIKVKLYTPADHLPKYMEFLMSDKEFRENTKAPVEVLGDVPMPLRTESLEAAQVHLQNCVNDFIGHFKEDEMRRTLHPVFGMLNFEEWVRLHYKHVMHHLKQFNLAR